MVQVAPAAEPENNEHADTVASRVQELYEKINPAAEPNPKGAMAVRTYILASSHNTAWMLLCGVLAVPSDPT